MKIHDENKNLLAIVIRSEQIEKGKNFVTNNDNEFQLASFLLDENEVIEKHYHPQQERNIKNTSEVLVLLEGEMLIEIFNSNLELVDTMSLYSGDTIGFYKLLKIKIFQALVKLLKNLKILFVMSFQENMWFQFRMEV
jgi:hypothetical protein